MSESDSESDSGPEIALSVETLLALKSFAASNGIAVDGEHGRGIYA
jgi:hypothetical protein